MNIGRAEIILNLLKHCYSSLIQTTDTFAKLVINGIKIATCSGYTFYELDNEPLLTIEDYNFILNSEDKPVAITKMLKVTIILMNEISELFATAEEKAKEIGPTDICVINMSLFSW